MFNKIKKDFFLNFKEFENCQIPDNALFKLWSNQMDLDFFINKNLDFKNDILSKNLLLDKFYYFNNDDPKILKFEVEIDNNKKEEDSKDSEEEDDSEELNENYNRLAVGGIDIEDYENNFFKNMKMILI